MKREYVMPRAEVELFEANAYVAVCYSLACDWEAANAVEQKNGTYSANPVRNQVNHGANGCGTATNQYITEVDGRVVIRELSADQGWLDCTVTSGTPEDIAVGTAVTWVTSSSSNGYTRTWHHQGTAEGLYPGHPNRS